MDHSPVHSVDASLTGPVAHATGPFYFRTRLKCVRAHSSQSFAVQSLHSMMNGSIFGTPAEHTEHIGASEPGRLHVILKASNPFPTVTFMGAQTNRAEAAFVQTDILPNP